VFWARDELCYPQYTRGPCPKGELLIATGSGGIAECKCNPTGILGQYYWASGDSCHEHFTKGPCPEQGTLFLPSGQCGCNEDLPHYDAGTGLCYEIGERNFSYLYNRPSWPVAGIALPFLFVCNVSLNVCVVLCAVFCLSLV
jgi:hypothetical protein